MARPDLGEAQHAGSHHTGLALLGWTLRGVSHSLMRGGLFPKGNTGTGEFGWGSRVQGGSFPKWQGGDMGTEKALHCHSFVTRAENEAGTVSCLSSGVVLATLSTCSLSQANAPSQLLCTGSSLRLQTKGLVL